MRSVFDALGTGVDIFENQTTTLLEITMHGLTDGRAFGIREMYTVPLVLLL